MRKIIYLSLFIVVTGLLAACSSSERPGEAAKKYAEYIAEGKYDKFMDGVVYNEDITTDKIKEKKDLLLVFLQEKGQKEIETKGGLKKVEVVSEVISGDGNSGKVILRQTYGDGATEDANYSMEKRDGSWKMLFN